MKRTPRFVGTDPLEALRTYIDQRIESLYIACEGEITSVDATKWLAKVMLMPDGVESGWLPIAVPHAGPGYGIVAMPPEGAQCTVLFLAGDPTVGKIVGFTFNTVDTPPPLDPGDILIQSAGGASVKLSGQSVSLNGGTAPIARRGDAVQVNGPNGAVYTGTITEGAEEVFG